MQRIDATFAPILYLCTLFDVKAYRNETTENSKEHHQSLE